MLTSDKCWLKAECKKYLDITKPCECRDSDVFCIKLFKIEKLYDKAKLTSQQKQDIVLYADNNGVDEDKFIQLLEIEKNIKTFVSNGDNLFIHSLITGNGKTAWAVRLLRSYLKSIWYSSELTCKGLFISVPRLLIALKDNISTKSEYIEYIKENVLDADLVVWDEIGTKGLTQFEHENLLNFINTRIDSGKSNIYTSNLSSQELKTEIGDRLYSRVVNLSTDIELKGVDKRGVKK